MNLRSRSSRLNLLILLLFLAFSAEGCIGLMPSPFRPSQGPQRTPQVSDLAEAFDIVCRSYRLGPDDLLTVLYQSQWNIPIGTYRLDTLDEISVKFLLAPQLNQDVSIRPDGMISLEPVGDIKAEGLRPEDLARKIEARFLKANIFIKNSTSMRLKNNKLVTVHVKDFYQKVARLVESLTTLTGGQQTETTVKPDGTIDLPMLKDRVLATGHTVSEVEDTVNRLYRSGGLKHVVVSVRLAQAKSRKVYVMGQVNNPGAFEIRQPITALQAIALAGGHVPEKADLTSVILISKNIYGKPIGRRLDLKKILDVGDMSSAILVKPYDVIYVPKTYVQDVRVFMDQYFLTASNIAEFVRGLTDIREGVVYR